MKTRVLTAKPSAFRGVNCITPNAIAYLAGQLAGAAVYIELSSESPPYWSQVVEHDPNGGPIYGVSIRRSNGESLEPDLSTSCSSLVEALEYLKSL